MSVNAFSTYRLIAIFFVTLTVTGGLYGYQAMKNLQKKLFKPTWTEHLFNALLSHSGSVGIIRKMGIGAANRQIGGNTPGLGLRLLAGKP